ncbi:GIY-YIG nuclease family protein [Patescibacteria group bacterium]
MKTIKTKLKSLPQKPGVYYFKNINNRIIYIGKALNIKKRVQSYFHQKKQDNKTQKMLEVAQGLGFQATGSEFLALLLEAKLIKEHQPQYNIQLKDGKRYLYIAISNNPIRIFPSRRPEDEKNLLDWYGPFPSGTAVREVLKILRRPFPYCSCLKPPRRQCLYAHINLCPGWQNLHSKEYQENIRQIRRILSGQAKLLSRDLKMKMAQAAKNLRFEQAQTYKNQLAFVEHITQGWRPIPGSNDTHLKALFRLRKLITRYQGISLSTISKIEGYDVSNLGDKIIVGAMVSFIEGEPEKSLYRKFKIKYSPTHPGGRHSPAPGVISQDHLQNDPASIHQIINRRLNHPEWLYPQLILVDGGKGQVSAAFKALKENELAGEIAILGLTKKEETIVIPKIHKGKIAGFQSLNYSPRSPVRQLLQQVRDEAHRFAQKYYRLLHQKKHSPIN